MKYDFDKIIDRSGTNALKYSVLKERYGRDDLIPVPGKQLCKPFPKDCVIFHQQYRRHRFYLRFRLRCAPALHSLIS